VTQVAIKITGLLTWEDSRLNTEQMGELPSQTPAGFCTLIPVLKKEQNWAKGKAQCVTCQCFFIKNLLHRHGTSNCCPAGRVAILPARCTITGCALIFEL